MSPNQHELVKTNNSFPRVSGDEPLGKPNLTIVARFSPRERG